jgi:hypothetical protein
MHVPELAKALTAVRLGPYSDAKVEDFLSYYDLDDAGSIEFDEFCELCMYEQRVKEETVPRTFYMREGTTHEWPRLHQEACGS